MCTLQKTPLGLQTFCYRHPRAQFSWDEFSFSLIRSFWQPWQRKAAQKTIKPLTASHPCKAVRGENQRSGELLMREVTTPHGPWEWGKPNRWQFVPIPQTGGQFTAETAAHARVSSILQRAEPKVKPQCVKSRPPAWTLSTWSFICFVFFYKCSASMYKWCTSL